MTRFAVYGVPGIDPGAPAIARRLREAAHAWYDRHPAITVDPRRYGFHATLKAPFALASGIRPDDLEQAVEAFAAERAPVVLSAVRPAVIGSFRALVPTGDQHGIDALAADVVRAFEPLRAPLADADIARRRPELLTERQREILHEVGYPYALDEFRCHLTLTDALDGHVDPAAVDAAIAEHFADIAGADIPLTALAICIEPAPGRPFDVHSIHPFLEIS